MAGEEWESDGQLQPLGDGQVWVSGRKPADLKPQANLEVFLTTFVTKVLSTSRNSTVTHVSIIQP